MRVLAPVTVAATGPTVVPVGPPGTTGAVLIANESPYYLAVGVGSTGPTTWLAPGTLDRVATNMPGFDGNLILTPTVLLSVSGAPSSLVFITAFAPGEVVAGTYPVALARQVAAGVSGSLNSNIINPATSPGNVYNVAKLYNGGTLAGPVTGLMYQMAGLQYPTVAFLDTLDYLLSSSPTSAPFSTTQTGQTYTQTVPTGGTVTIHPPSKPSNTAGAVDFNNNGKTLILAINTFAPTTGDMLIMTGTVTPSTNLWINIYLSASAAIYVQNAAVYFYLNSTYYAVSGSGNVNRIRVAWTPTAISCGYDAVTATSTAPPALASTQAFTMGAPAISAQIQCNAAVTGTFGNDTAQSAGTALPCFWQINTP